jgi:hypothetical protein
MALSTCSAFQGLEFTWPTAWGTSGRYKIISDRTFVFNGKIYPAGRISDPIDQNWCALGTITISSGIPTFSSFTLPQTDVGITDINSSGEPRFTLIIYSNSGRTKRNALFQNWRIGQSLTTSFSFEDLAIYNTATQPANPRPYYLDADAVNNLITSRLNAPATTTQLGIVRIDTAAVDSSDPEVVGSNSPLLYNNARVFNVQNPAYAGGATGNGTTDDTAAILATIAAWTANGGGKLYFPHPTNSYLIDGSGAQILLLTKSGIIEGEDSATVIKIKSTVASGVYAFRYKPATTADSEGFQIRNLWIQAQSGTPGAGIAIDSTNAFIANFNISNVIVSQLGGKALTLTNPTHRADGIFLGTVEKSQFFGDVLFDYVGDSIHVVRNDFAGTGGVSSTQIGGAAMLDFSHNNITCDGGVIFHSGKNIRFHHNEIELQASTNTGSGGAMVYFQGDIGAVSDASIMHNLLQGGGAAPSLNGFQFDNQSGAEIGDNTYSLPTGTSLIAVNGGLSGIFYQVASNHARGVSMTDVSGAVLYFYNPIVTVGATASEQGGAIWITNLKGTDLITTNSSQLTNISTAQQFVSSLATGTAPFSIASTTKVANLNVDLLDGTDWRAPGAIGGITPGSGAFTTLSATGQVTSTLATGTAPLAIISTTPVANLTATPLTYRPDGTQITNAHIVSGTVVLDGAGTATVTLAGGAIYASATAFQCVAGYFNSGGAPQIIKNSGTSITFNGTATFTIWFICISY